MPVIFKTFKIFLLIFSNFSGSYYSSGRGEDDVCYNNVKTEMTCMDDSETNICELDDNNGEQMMRQINTDNHRLSLINHHHHHHQVPLPFASLVSVSSSTTTTTLSNHAMFSPPPPPPLHGRLSNNLLHSTLHMTNNNNHNTTTTTTTTPSSMTPIDKLYSMQSSYFNNPSECEC